jgi:putative ABC transport system permease protein
MIKNYIKIAFRNLLRHKGFSSINVIGLAVGMAAFLLIFMYVTFELSYDSFHAKGEQVYRLNVDLKSANDLMKVSQSTAPMGPALKADFPEILDYTRVFNYSDVIKVKDEQPFLENRIFIAEPSFFNIFSFPLIKGDPKTALKNPYTVILTESTAKKYFGAVDPMGKSIMLGDKYPLLVTGIVRDAPTNTQFKFDLLYSVVTLDAMFNGRLENWGNFGNYTFLLLAKGTDPAKLEAKFPAFLKKHISEENRKGGQDYNLYLKPLKDAYMDSRGGIEQGSMSNVYIFSIVALFILLIAAINFINLTTARATERAKEVGLRKVIGAARAQLTLQFLGESVLICLMSFIVATLLVSLLLPLFNQLSGKIISQTISEHGYIFILLFISLAIGLAAGAYPALTLSAFKPIVVLKGRFSSSSKGTLLRKGLVVFQFTISIVLIVGTIVVYKQLNYMRDQPLGFEKNQLLTIDFGNDYNVIKSYESIKNEFKAIPNVSGVAISHGLPGVGSANAHSEFENRQSVMQPLNINMYDVDYDFIPLYGMKIIAGRAFSKDFPTDSTQSVVINEATVKTLGYSSPGEAIGKKFSQWGREGKIVGVVKNFHYRSLQENIEPLNMRINPSNARIFTIKIASTDVKATMAAIENKWKTLLPQWPFNYAFVDEHFNVQYLAEERFGKLFLYFAVLAIFISCLGLLGLASYSTLQRTREIGIRKVLGASVVGIVNMLSVEFMQLVLIAAIIAFPISWFGMHAWLKDYAYRITINWFVFVAAGVLAFTIAILTVSFQAIKASLANPVKSLRSE